MNTQPNNNDLQKQTQRLEAQTRALIQLSKMSFDQHDSIDDTLKEICDITAEAVDVGRVSIWFFDASKENLICKGSNNRNGEREFIIERSLVPKYFEALENRRCLAVVKANENEYTSELTATYLKDFNIKSMLDAYIRTTKGANGVICCESVGAERHWHEDEKSFVASVADIVARLTQEYERFDTYQKLIEQEAIFKAVIEHISEGTMILDNKGRHTYVSPAMERITGFTQEDLMGRELGFSMTEEERSAAWDVMDEIISGKGKKVYSLEREFPKKDGSKANLLSLVYNLIDEPHINGIVIINRDITDLRNAEKQLVRSKKMEVLGQLTGGLAHDFNNLLAIISGNSHLLASFLSDDPRLIELVNEIKFASLRGEALIKRLLSVSRGSSMKAENVLAGNVVLNMEHVLNKLLPEGVDLNLNLGRTEWSVGVDVGSLENSIINMVLNAKDAMPDGGNITIETEGVTLAEPLTGALVEVAAGDYVTISIKDDGTGMDAPTAERSLEPFFTTKLSGAGTGLGLSMVHRFVESSNAGLVLNTKLGEGTSFVIYLPRVQLEVEETTDSAMTVSGSKGEGQTILVVDDEPALLKLLVNILEPVGYNVVEAINAQDAIDMLDANPDIDAVITDVVMPGVLNGFDLALHAKETKPDMPVILLSGYSEQTLAQDARYERFVGCLVEKPIDYMELTKRLGQALLSKNQVCC